MKRGIKAPIHLITIILIIVFLLLSPLLNSSNGFNFNLKTKFPLLKVASTPSKIWNYTWGGDGYDFIGGMALDSSDNIYVAATTESLGGDDADLCLTKFNADGDTEWNYIWGGSSFDYGEGVALDSSDNVYVVGSTSINKTDDSNICLVKFNINGDVEWYHTWGNSSNEWGRDVTLDSSGNAYVVGIIHSLGGVGSEDACLVKFNTNGGVEWKKIWSLGDTDDPAGVALDSSGNIYVVGTIHIIGAYPNIFLVKFNATGEVEWDYIWGGNSDDYGWAIALDSSDNIYVGGSTRSIGTDRSDMCLVKFKANGTLEWFHTWGGSGNDYGTGIALDSSGNIYLSGTLASSYVSNTHICLVKFNTNGGFEWYRIWGGDGYEHGEDVALDSLGNMYLSGKTYSFGEGGDLCLVKFGISTTDNHDDFRLIIIAVIIGSVVGTIGVIGTIFFLKKRNKS